MTTIDEMERALEGPPAVIPLPEVAYGELGAADATSALRRLLGALAALGEPGLLAKPRMLLERERAVNEAAARCAGEAQQRLQRVRGSALTSEDVPGALAELAAAVQAAEPWVPAGPGQDAPAMVEARRLARGALTTAILAATGEADGAYRRLQAVAAEAVEATAAAPLPAAIWSAGAPVQLVMDSPHPGSHAVLLQASMRFGRVHEAAALLRSLGGVQPMLPGAAPRLAWQFKAWVTASQGQEELRRIPSWLRLRWTCERGWLPGLWFAHDIDGLGDPAPKPAPPKRWPFGR